MATAVALVALVAVSIGAASEQKSLVKHAGQAAAGDPETVPPDIVPPVIHCPPDTVFECDAMGDPGVATATDDMDPGPVIAHRDTVVFYRCPYEYTYVRTWTATDWAGNSSSCDQTVLIQDSTAPVILCPPDTTVACEDWNEVGWAYATDNCNPNLGMSYEPVAVVGVERWHHKVIRFWEVTDSCCNKAGCQQIVTLLDTIPPLLACSANDTIPCDWPMTFPQPAADDNCTAEQQIVIEIASVDTVPGPEGCEYTVTTCWTARDDFGNVSAPCCQSISVADCADLCTFTIGGWGSRCPESQQQNPESTQPGCIRDYYFGDVLPDGVMIGDTSSAGLYGAIWTSAAAVEAFLPDGGTAGVLTEDLEDPLTTPAGVLGSQVLALRLNREYSCAGVSYDLGISPVDTCYGESEVPMGCGNFSGLTVDEFLAIADRVVAGDLLALDPYGANLGDLVWTATCLNERYDDCEAALMALAASPADPAAGTDTGTGSGMVLAAPRPEAQPMAGQATAWGIHPNPVRARTAIEFSTAVPGRVTVEIFDVRGSKVARVLDEDMPAGSRSLVWDGTTSAGEKATRGVYFCRIQVPGRPAILEKIVKLE